MLLDKLPCAKGARWDYIDRSACLKGTRVKELATLVNWMDNEADRRMYMLTHQENRFWLNVT